MHSAKLQNSLSVSWQLSWNGFFRGIVLTGDPFAHLSTVVHNKTVKNNIDHVLIYIII